MRQASFQRSRSQAWEHFEASLVALESKRPPPDDFARAYRALCQDLALAQERGFTARLVDRLQGLALRGHQVLYGARANARRPWRRTLLAFPRALRREWRPLLWMTLLFYGSGALVFTLCRLDPDLVYSLVGGAAASQFEQMYDPNAPHMGAPRAASGSLGAFGYYIYNNIGIAFRCFASGIFFGLGSIFLVGFNGAFLGAIAAHVTELGYGESFWPFVIGHGSFELTAIVISGVCGLRLGLALVAPGRRRRLEALQYSARRVVPLLYGATGMLVVAAVIEAFWSSNHAIPPTLRYAAGAFTWLLVLSFLSLGGRRDAR